MRKMKEPAFKRAEPDARRQSLIEPARACWPRRRGASVRAIAQEAGVSPGLVNHYFDGWMRWSRRLTPMSMAW
jgi:AcrR family transcriptional regulator